MALDEREVVFADPDVERLAPCRSESRDQPHFVADRRVRGDPERAVRARRDRHGRARVVEVRRLHDGARGHGTRLAEERRSTHHRDPGRIDVDAVGPERRRLGQRRCALRGAPQRRRQGDQGEPALPEERHDGDQPAMRTGGARDAADRKSAAGIRRRSHLHGRCQVADFPRIPTNHGRPECSISFHSGPKMARWYSRRVPLLPGDELAGRYRIVSSLGAGGAASVFVVEDVRAGTERVLKQLRLPDPELVASFRAEFALLSTLAHPSVTHVLDFGSARVRGELLHFYTAERIEGRTLAEHARTRRDRAVLEPVLDALEGLTALHELGVRHGDFTLENVLVRDDGRGVLIDFGCARPFHESTGTLAGTPGYLAPELLAKGGGDARADLYAVGCVLERLVRLGALRAEPRLRTLIARLLAEHPRDRPATVDDVLQALGRERPRTVAGWVAPPRMVGREAEVAAFSRWLHAFTAGEPGSRVFALEGVSGAGVSRLFREMVGRAELATTVLRASASEPEPGGSAPP
nr:MAG: hypothetical protein DIU78_12975 [Pseudomonadota bacterium]